MKAAIATLDVTQAGLTFASTTDDTDAIAKDLQTITTNAYEQNFHLLIRKKPKQ